MNKHAKDSVLISGASTGIGKSCALRLAGAGFTVWAGVRRNADAQTLAGLSNRIRPVILDITDADSIGQAMARIREGLEGQVLKGLINNAGIAIGGPLEFLPLEDFRRQIEVNLTGQVALTQAALPLLREASARKHSARIVNMGSVAGLSAVPFAAPYSASKFALEAITDALRVELRPWRIGVSIIEPGVIRTPIWEKSMSWAEEAAARISPEAFTLYGPALEAFRNATVKSASKGIEPDAVAEATHHALTAKKPRPRYLVGPDAQWRPWFAALPEHCKDWLLVKKIGLE